MSLCNAVSADRKAQVLKALNRSTEAYGVLQRLQVHCEKTKNTEVVIRWGHACCVLTAGRQDDLSLRFPV